MMLRRVYELFGIDSVGFFYGVDGVYTHVTTLVPFEGEWIVQDAYFNTEWTDVKGTALSILQVLEDLEKERFFRPNRLL